jgi:hypothetical protein
VAGDDAVVVRVAGQRRDDVAIAVEQARAPLAAVHARQRLVGDDDHARVAGGGERPRATRLLGGEHAAEPTSRRTVSSTIDADRAAGVEGVVHARAAAAVAAGGAQPRDGLARGQLAARGSGATRAVRPRQPAAQRAVDELRRERVLAARHVEAGVGRDEALAADGDRCGRRRPGQLARDQQVVVAGHRVPRRAQTGARRARWAARAARGGAGGSTSGR